MKVVVTVGQTSREITVRDDLLYDRFSDRAQDTAILRVGAAFTDAYMAEVRRAEKTRSEGPSQARG
jgi:hypothetical protein